MDDGVGGRKRKRCTIQKLIEHYIIVETLNNNVINKVLP